MVITPKEIHHWGVLGFVEEDPASSLLIKYWGRATAETLQVSKLMITALRSLKDK